MQRAIAMLCITITTSANLHAAGFSAAMATNVANSRYGWRTVALEVYSGIVEKAECASIATNYWPTPPGWYGQRAKGLEYKTFIKTYIAPRYVDYTVTNAAGQYYASNAGAQFVTFSGSSLCERAGVSTEYLDRHGWYDWQSTNSWQLFADVLNQCRWTWDYTAPGRRNNTRPLTYPDGARSYEDNEYHNTNHAYQIAIDIVRSGSTAAQSVSNYYVAYTNPQVGCPVSPCPKQEIYTNNIDEILPKQQGCGIVPNRGSFYGVFTVLDTNSAPATTNWQWETFRYHSWTWLDKLSTNYSHKAEIYGYTETWVTNLNPAGCTASVSNEWRSGDNPLWNHNEFRNMYLFAGGASTTNYRAPVGAKGTKLALFETKLFPLRNDQNPLVVLGLDDSTPQYHYVKVGVNVSWTNTYFLMKWDANAATGMQYIFD